MSGAIEIKDGHVVEEIFNDEEIDEEVVDDIINDLLNKKITVKKVMCLIFYYQINLYLPLKSMIGKK